MHMLTVAWDQLVKINDALLNRTKCKILKFQGLRVGIYYVLFFLIFLQINNAIPYLLAVQKNSFLVWILSHLKIKHFEPPPCLQNSTYENKIVWDAHLKSHISRWLLLLSVILQNM